MGEEQLLQLASKFLETPKGKSLLGEAINISDITNRIQELSTRFNIDLSTLENANLEDINLSLGSNLTREQKREKRREKRLSRKELIAKKKEEAVNGVTSTKSKVREEISTLKAKLKSQTPILQEYTITGRLQDANNNTPLKGVKVTLGVSAALLSENLSSSPLAGLPDELIPQGTDIESSNFIFTPIPGQSTRTDKDGNFNIKIKIPIIPETQRSPLDFGLLYSKGGFLPGTQAILNGDKTIKTSLQLTSIINIKKSADKISNEFNDKIDQAQKLAKTLAMSIPDKIIYARKLAISKLLDNLRQKLLPLCVSMLLSFGIAKLTESNRKTCPTPEELNAIIRKRNSTVRQLNQLFKMVTINTALAAAFLILGNVLKGVRLSMDALPTPQATGVFPAKDFGGLIFALPYSFTAKLQHLNDELEKLEEQNKGLNRSILTSLVFLIAGLATTILILKEVDKMTEECASENGVTNLELEAINQELLDLGEEQEEDGNPKIGSINGFFLSVETDNKNLVGTLKRRFAVAKDSRGVILLKGEPSFSSSDQILIDELVFYIQQNGLKAF